MLNCNLMFATSGISFANNTYPPAHQTQQNHHGSTPHPSRHPSSIQASHPRLRRHTQHIPPLPPPPNLPLRLPLPAPHTLPNRIPPHPHRRRKAPMALHDVFNHTLPLHLPRSALHQLGTREAVFRVRGKPGEGGGRGGEGRCCGCAGGGWA